MPTYSTTLFPDVIGQTYQRLKTYRSLISDRTAPAADQAVSKAGTNLLWQYSLAWTVLAQSDAEALLHAAEFMGGDVSGLYFFEWRALSYVNAYVGLGDGTANAITLPVKGASAGTTVVRVNGTPITGTFNAGAGTNGEPTFIPSGTIANGATIRSDFVGRRRRKVRFFDGNGSFKLTVRPRSSPLLWQATAHLIETDASDI